MGFDISAINFLFHARKKGVPFSRILMLGRQSYQLDEPALKKCFERNGRPAGDASRLLEEDPVYVEPFLRYIGAGTVHSMDASAYEHATLIHDLNQPVPDNLAGQYDVVIDAGTLEHVFNFPVAVSNAMRMVKPGGYFLSITVANNFFGHGFYQFSPELFYRVFSPENGFKMDEMFFTTTRPFSPWYQVPDPKAVRGRVVLENCLQSYLLVCARKEADKSLFGITPQQSDYEWIAWQQGDAAAPAAKNMFSSLARLLPEGVKQLVRQMRRTWRTNRMRLIVKDYGSGKPEYFEKVRQH